MKKFLKLLFISFFYFTALFAGNTGKIVGVVTDSQTGETLPGANVLVDGTLLGASSDVNGEFFILNVPPGVYAVECLMLGYATKRIENIEVQSDLTTQIDFVMTEETLELGEKITVIADRPLVQKDLTSSKKVTNAEEIKALPVETFTGVMLTQSGITQGADGEIHIKGGRSNEIAYLVDGISVANPYSTNGLGVTVATNAIQEMTVVSGAFNAEYGNAMSGVVNLTTKDGTPDYRVYINAYTGDYISNKKDLFFNIDDVNAVANNNIEATFSGQLPFLNNNSNTFFLSARISESDGYLYGVREHLPSDSANFLTKEETITEKEDFGRTVTRTIYSDEWYIELGGDGKKVAMNPSESINLLGKIKYQLSPAITLRLQSIFNNGKYKSYSHLYRFNPDGVSTTRSNGIQNSFQITHTLSNSTFYELRGSVNYKDTKTYLYEDPGDSRYVPTDKVKGNPAGVNFLFGGTQMGHAYEKSWTYLGKFDLTSQVNKKHLIKGGLEARLYRMDSRNFTILYDRNFYKKPTVLDEGTEYHDQYEVYPRQISAYLQDKIEYDDMIINAGLRYDYFFSDFDYAPNILQPDGNKTQADPKHMLAPRLGVSYPITEKGIIHFSYGHFFQMPSLRYLYSNPDFELPTDVGAVATFGNANLNPQKTISYEIGLQQQLGDRFAMDLTAFYKDVRDLLASQTIKFTDLVGRRRDYRVWRNQDYGNIKGITFSLNKRMAPGDPIAASIDYTYQVAEGNNNDTDAFFYNALSGQEDIKEIVFLDWDQPHTLNATVTVQLSQGLMFSTIGNLSSGYPYTPDIPNSTYDALTNNERKPTRKGMDMRLSYDFSIADINYQIFAKVYNVFDTKNERYVFDDTGTAEYTFVNRSRDEPEILKERYDQPGVHTYDEYVTRPDYYFSPREVRLGLSIEF